jgi:hypothetical protein
MTKLLKTAAIAAILTGFANAGHALEAVAPTEMPGIHAMSGDATPHEYDTQTFLPDDAKIGVARLDGGRLIPTPFGEEFDWKMLDRRVDLDIETMNAGDYLKYIPEIPMDGVDTDNKIDEIRLTAANEGYSHVILYGLGTDAYWGSFGGKAIERTGLDVASDCDSWAKAKAKALLVNAHTGEVLGAALTNNVEFNIGYLADDVERMLATLT